MATTSRKRRPSTRRKPATAPRKRTAASPGPVANLATKRNLSIAGAVVGVGAAIAGAFAWLRLRDQATDGHAAPDLDADARPTAKARAPKAFRPDMDAPMTKAEREALRPAKRKPALVSETIN